MSESPIRNLDDGHLSSLDFDAIQDNLRERLAGLESRATDAQRSWEVTPGDGVITYPMLISSEQHGDTGEIFSQLPNFDGITMITGIEPLMLAGMPCIKSPTGNEGIDLYFVASAVDDVKDVASGQNGFRSGAPMNVKVCARVHGTSTGGIDKPSITHVTDEEYIPDIWLFEPGDAWWALDPAGHFGQSFTVSPTETNNALKAIELYVKNNGEPSGTMQIALTSVEGVPENSTPGDILYWSEEVPVVNYPEMGMLVDFNFPNYPTLTPGNTYQIRIFGDPSVYVNAYDLDIGPMDGNASHYDTATSSWVADPDKDIFMQYLLASVATTNLLTSTGTYRKWQDISADATMLFNHGLYSDEGYADFKIHIPGEMALNALCIQDKATGGELHWRCGHVRTRHINPHMAFPLNIDNGMTLTADGKGGMSWQSPFVPGFWTSTDWDGDAKNGADGVIDLSDKFGLPAGIKAVAVRFTIRGGTAGTYARLSATSGSLNKGLVTRVQVANQAIDTGGIVPCDDNGDIYFSQSAALTEVYIYISGYFI